MLELLLDEDVDVPDVWYMLGWANYLQGADYAANARHYLSKARQVMDSAATAKHCLPKARMVDCAASVIHCLPRARGPCTNARQYLPKERIW